MNIKINTNRTYESVGINTFRENKETPMKDSFIKKIINNSLFTSLTNFIVNRRVKRKSQLANSGTGNILI